MPRQRAALAALLAITAGFVLVAMHFVRRGFWGAALTVAILALMVGLYVTARLWPHLPRPEFNYRPTRSGVLYIFAIFAVAFTALSSGNNLLFLVLATMLAALLVSGFASRLNLAELELQCVVPEHVFAGEEAPARFVMRNLKSWVSSFSIMLRMELPPESGLASPEVYFPMLSGGQTASAMVGVRFPRRGRYRQEVFRVRSGFPFGFLMKSVPLRLPREILVYPSVAPTAALEATLASLTLQWERQQRGLGQDLYRIRPYQTGDSSRLVHWKASAHTGELKVREFAVEEDRSVEILFDSSVPAGEVWLPRFEKAVQLCASLAWQLHTSGAGLRFVPANVAPAEAQRLENVYDILRYLALVEAVENGPPIQAEPSGIFQVVFTAHAARIPASLPESSYYGYFLENL